MGLQALRRFLLRAAKKVETLSIPELSQQVDIEQLQAEQLTFAAPYFVLSTGRCGTEWLTELLRLSRYAHVNHRDHPELIRHSRMAYEQYAATPRVFVEIIRATRDEFIAEAYRRGQVYVETNNRITFFAYAIRQAYPKARFIHLVRHPGDFVRSGLNRKWYRGQRHDIGRIVKPDPAWQTMSDVEKIAWLWNQTNHYIEGFLAELPRQDTMQVKAEAMFSDPAVGMDLLRFIGVSDISPKTVRRMLSRRINRQRQWAVDPYREWPEEHKAQIRREAVLAGRYGYEP
jgi:hypothetical protein